MGFFPGVQKTNKNRRNKMTEIKAISRFAPGLPTLINKYAAHENIFVAGEDNELFVQVEVEAGKASSFCNQAARLRGVCYTDAGEFDQDRPISQWQSVTIYLCNV